MRIIYLKISVLILLYFLLTQNLTFAFSETDININNYKNYQAVVLGEMVDKKIKKAGNYYLTEYKLKTKKWLFKQANIKEANYLKIKVLGAEFPNRGIVIKSSAAPDYIPMNSDAIFLLENNKKPKKNTFTIPKNGVIVLKEQK